MDQSLCTATGRPLPTLLQISEQAAHARAYLIAQCDSACELAIGPMRYDMPGLKWGDTRDGND